MVYIIEMWNEGSNKEKRPEYKMIVNFKGFLRCFEIGISKNKIAAGIRKSNYEDKEHLEAKFSYVWDCEDYHKIGFDVFKLGDRKLLVPQLVPVELKFKKTNNAVGFED